MRVCRPALIAGHASACAGVGEAKLSENQFATAGWNRGWTAVGGGGGAERFPAPVSAFNFEARSEFKLPGSHGRREIAPAYIWPWIGLWSPSLTLAALADRGWRGPKASVRTPFYRRAMDRAYKCSLAEYGGLRQVFRLSRREVQMVRVRQQFAPPNRETTDDQ